MNKLLYENGVSQIIDRNGEMYKVGPKDMTNREYEIYCKLLPYGYTAECEMVDDKTLHIERIEETEVTDEDEWLSHYDKILDMLTKENIKHGDLTSANVIPHNNKPVIIDFNESVYFSENKITKRPEPDSFWLHRAMMYHLVRPRAINARMPEAWYHLRHKINEHETIIDLGCGNGDVGIWAEKYKHCSVKFVDKDKRKIGNVVNRSTTLPDEYCETIEEFIKRDMSVDVIFCFAVFPYIEDKEGLLDYIKGHCKRAYFEIQTKDDGPGTMTLSQIKKMLHKWWVDVNEICFTVVEYREKKRHILECI